MLDKSRDPPDILVGRGALTSLRRDLLAAMADQQVQKQGNVVQRLGEMSAAKSKRSVPCRFRESSVDTIPNSSELNILYLSLLI